MGEFRFTPFNMITLATLAMTAGMAVARAKVPPKSRWPFAYYAAVLAFALVFRYSLNAWAVAAGAACAALARSGRPAARAARVAEYGILAYIFARCVALLLMW